MAIIAVDIACPVGLCIEQAATSVAAGVSRIEETNWIAPNGNPIKMGRIADDALPPLIEEIAQDRSLTQHAQRLIRLGSIALKAVTEKLGEHSAPVHGFFAMPESGGGSHGDPATLVQSALANTETKLKFAATHVFTGGRASMFQALLAAETFLAQTPDAIAVVGGIDSFHDPILLSQLGSQERLLTDGVQDGMIPGEGAAMLICIDADSAASMNVQPIALINAVAVAEEPGHLTSDDPCMGDGSTEVLAGALKDCEAVHHVYLSFNGEHIWAQEWSIAFLRHSDCFVQGHGVHHPAEHFGDSGAASGAMMTALSAFALASGKASGEHLVWCASDGPLRGACTLSSPLQPAS
ncbi:hypothetical protein [Stieleria neptunia]|nr:hypothetical protein [Stieleria neptunia]